MYIGIFKDRLLMVVLSCVLGCAYLAYKILSSTTITFSNIVGPKEEVSFCCHKMTYVPCSQCLRVPNVGIMSTLWCTSHYILSELTNHDPPHYCIWQVACCDIADFDWSSHSHRGRNPQRIRTQLKPVQVPT